MWAAPSYSSIDEDFAAIAELGVDHVRLFPLWPLLQPNAGWIDPKAVDRVLDVVELAKTHGLDAEVDVLQGHLSSFDFLPSWVSTWHEANIFTEPRVVEAEERLIRLLARELSGVEGAFGLGLGNEIVQFSAARNPHAYPLTQAQAATWTQRLLSVAKEQWPDGIHSISFDEDVWFDDFMPFTPELAASAGDVTTVHSWIFGKVGEHYGDDYDALVLFARYLVELANAWGNRPIWLQEIGAPVPLISPERSAGFLTDVLGTLASAPNLEAVTWWCSHDVNRKFADFPELEYSLGLLDSQNRVKPAGKALKRAIGAFVEKPAGVRGALSFDGTRRSQTAPGGELFAAWLEAAKEGQMLALEESI
jgi:endo-1,4-beta-mannosidase